MKKVISIIFVIIAPWLMIYGIMLVFQWLDLSKNGSIAGNLVPYYGHRWINPLWVETCGQGIVFFFIGALLLINEVEGWFKRKKDEISRSVQGTRVHPEG